MTEDKTLASIFIDKGSFYPESKEKSNNFLKY